MKNNLDLELSPADIAALSSIYIDQGIKQEAWEIQAVKFSGSMLTATARMTSTFISPTDPDGFHLTIFSTQEILAQLANIHLHVTAGHKTKCRESWMRECHFNYRNVIRQPDNIKVEMDMVSHRWAGDTLVGKVNCRMRDDNGGLFIATLKGMLR
ncbi:hypothetical protein [Elongatibacter sediminis]|uniref:MaoC-like domain-containing protein n=1 Tax=Elongatibacter sediminis TaxID=3119006 RepID=A0AAW9RJW1_9GAMM